ncbi:gliding motility-associated C-terminal domain-containing protein [Mucilaginibacter sp.]|uniref:gliding motility-associated C-terminal domain-containing protein n=1 Tax=Mucilaginibacter sp. TaxID=1882438 RepID=UPI0035BBC4F8
MFRRTVLLFIFAVAIGPASSSRLFAQGNIGFENGNFDNWEFAVGSIETNGKITTYPSIAVPGSFTILKNDGSDLKDNYGKFPVFSPNGSKYSVKLGNELYGNTVQQMSYTITVPPTGSSSIVFDYAVVLENPGHEPYQQPRFTVKVYNVTDDKYLTCPSFDFISSVNLPGFKYNSDGVFFKDWSSASINLTGLNNKKIRLEFTVNHCPFGEHAGYAYIDINENISTPVGGNNFCKNQSNITLSGPPGFANYSWSTGDLKTPLGTGQFLTIQPPADATKLALTVTPYNGLGCPDTFYFDVNGINSDFNFVATDAIISCPGTSVDLTAPSITSGSSPGLTFDYLTDSFELLSGPSRITANGLYYIRAKNAGGCSNLLPVKVTFELPQLQIIVPPPVKFPETVDLSATFSKQQGVSYYYYTDEAASEPLVDFTAIATTGKYYVKAETADGCINIQPVSVTVSPPDPFTVTAPNTFTPNNDGVNDTFTILLTGYIKFNGLKIYNRNGNLIFKTSDAAQFWDGTYNGRPVPSGTYYWIFDGYDNYYRKKVTGSSFITVIR